ncbi:MAG: Lysine decarboxylase family, partial [uncultured Gemmatimonadetes bacterium]
EANLCVLWLQRGRARRVRAGSALDGHPAGRARHRPGVRRRARGADGRGGRRGAGRRRRGRRRDPRGADAARGGAPGPDRASRGGLHARTQGADGRPVRRLHRHARRLRHLRGVLRGAHLVAAGHSSQALRPAERGRLLRAAARHVRPRRRRGLRPIDAPRHRAGGRRSRFAAGTDGRVPAPRHRKVDLPRPAI